MNLANEYAHAAECNMVTLEQLAMTKSSSASRVRRQIGICNRMVEVCKVHENDIEWTRGARELYSRVREIHAARVPAETSYELALMRFVAKCRS